MDAQNKEMELARLKDQFQKKDDLLQSHMSGFSIGESDTDKVRIQLKNLRTTFEEEKERKHTVIS
jgi:hypothetical protein